MHQHDNREMSWTDFSTNKKPAIVEHRYRQQSDKQGTLTIKPHFTPNDPLSKRIFKDNELPASPQSVETPLDLRTELKSLKKENAALQRSLQLSSNLRQRFKTLFDEYPLGLVSFDAETQILEANLTLAKLLHLQRAQLIGKHIGNFVAPQDQAQFIQHLEQLRDGENLAHTHCKVTLITARQTQLEVQIESTLQNTGADSGTIIHSRISPLENADQPGHHDDLASSDAILQKEINDREQAEEQSRRHQEELAHIARLNTMGEMASGLAHEINQPLTAIHSYAKSCLRMLDAGADKQAQVPFLLGHICKQAQRAASIIRHLRDFVSKSACHRENTELSQVVQLAMKMMRAEFKKHGITLELETQADLPLISADTVQLEQVIINLLRNACETMSKTSDKTRQLHIKLDKPHANHVRVAISDSGPGIAPEDEKKIATPFFSTKKDGMGLGLAISRTIVEDHGGELTHKTNENGGTTFSFTLAIDGKQKHTEN